MKTIFAYLLGLLLLLVLTFGLSYFALFQFGYFAPKFEAVKREVFVNTPSFILGKEQELAKYRGEYLRGDESTKAIIKSVISQSIAGVDRSDLSAQSRAFLAELKF